jgi:hypothetical protein
MTIEERIVRDVRKHGWHVIMVPEDEEGPGFAYTIGLLKTLDHPERIMFGLDVQVMHAILNDIGYAIRSGLHLDTQNLFDDFLEGLPLAFRPVNSRHFDEYVAWAQWFHEQHGKGQFAVWQCFWPAENGLFPWDWDESCPPHIRAKQPRLDQ